MSAKYMVLRPPLAHTFSLPSREELLKQKPGDVVKVIFKVDGDSPERMWVILQDCRAIDAWAGIVDSDAVQINTLKTLPAGAHVQFHPLDIIQILKEPFIKRLLKRVQRQTARKA